jgi:hypothetical protein
MNLRDKAASSLEAKKISRTLSQINLVFKKA